jgi:hypothetical protein
MDRKTLIPFALAALLAAAGCTRSDTRSQPKAADSPAKSSAAQPGLTIGETIPMANREMKSVNGSMVSIASVKGEKGTLVIFTCNHCPYVKAWQDRTVSLANQALKDGFGVIAINPNDPAAYPEDDFEGMVIRANAQKMNYPYVMDATSEVARVFGATRTPEIYLFDASDHLVYHGAVDDNARSAKDVSEHYLRDALNAVANGEQIAKPETRSVGCSIKLRKVGAGS